MKKIVLGVLLLLVVVVGGGLGFLVLRKPAQRPPSTERIEATPERLARGRYLVEAVTGCLECHSEHEKQFFGQPAKEPFGAGGGFCLTREIGFPGHLCATNITPDPDTGIGRWTDGELLRAMREGVGRDGEALFPAMPYGSYRLLSDEDAKSIVAYLRTLPAARKERPQRHIDFPVSAFIKFAPKPLDGPVLEPNRADPVAYGRYLATIASCEECHTPLDERHQPMPGMAFAGGREFKETWGTVRSANITPDSETGIGAMTKEAFIGRFKAFAHPESARIKVAPEHNTVMPWPAFAKMTEEDLGALYAYLRTVPPVKNAVERRPPPPIPAAQAGTP